VKAVFDTNVFVAAFITEGICSKILVRGRKKQFHLIACPIILREFERVLITKFSITRNEAQSVNRGLKTSQKQDLKTYHQVEETHEDILEPTQARNLSLISKRTNPVLA